MGTNFYLVPLDWDPTAPDADPEGVGVHIGKRSAAGAYCWDCGVTLCAAGEAGVHRGNPLDGWLEACPVCGRSRRDTPEDLAHSAAGRELGFNHAPPAPKKGVRSCSSFSWAVHPEEFARDRTGRKVADEYGRTYTPEEFDAVLAECPIQYYDAIGRTFF